MCAVDPELCKTWKPVVLNLFNRTHNLIMFVYTWCAVYTYGKSMEVTFERVSACVVYTLHSQHFDVANLTYINDSDQNICPFVCVWKKIPLHTVHHWHCSQSKYIPNVCCNSMLTSQLIATYHTFIAHWKYLWQYVCMELTCSYRHLITKCLTTF